MLEDGQDHYEENDMKAKTLIPIVLSVFLVLGGLAWWRGRQAVTTGDKPSAAIGTERGSSLQTRSPRAAVSPRDILLYLDAHAGRLPRTVVDRHLQRLLSLQDAGRKSYEARLFSDALNSTVNQYSFQDLNHPERIKDAKVRDLLQGILGDGFRLAMPEGMLCFTTDFPALSRKYGRYASARMQDYLGIMAVETARPYSEDAGLLITPDELARRIVPAEGFIKSYPHFARVADVERLRGQYLTAYLIGLNNTPAFDYVTSRLEDRFFESYRSTAAKYEGTDFARLVRGYLTVLQRNGYRKTRTVLDFAVKAVDQR